MKKFILFIWLSLTACSLWASAVSFKAELSHSRVAVGQRFRITFTINSGGGNFTAPSFENFRLLSGPNQSRSMQYINGKASQTFSISYILQASKVGKFTFDPAVINVDGKRLESNKVEIEVVDANSGAAAQNQKQDERKQNGRDLSDYVYIKSFVDKRSVYVGEALTVTYKLYSRLGMRSINLEDLPNLNGFWSHDLHSVYDQIELTTEYIKGEVYQVAILKQSLLYPQRSGKLTVDPLEMKAEVQLKTRRSRSIFESMFGSYETQELIISSRPIVVDVKPLPKYQGDGDFSGAVGKFDLKLLSNKTTLKANEAVDLKMELSGEGNLPLVGAPQLNFPPDLEVYDPETQNLFKNSSSGSQGKKVFNYLVIPRHSGNYLVESFKFTYFDPQAKTYRSVQTDSLILKVEKGTEESSMVYDPSSRKEDVELLENDIRYIHLSGLSLIDQDELFFGSFPYYLFVFVFIVGIILLFFLSRRHKERQADKVGRRKSKARKIARKRLSNARKFLDKDQQAEFYEEIAKALYGYFADRYNMGVSELSIEELKQQLSKESATENLIQLLSDSLEQSEMARYAPSSAIEAARLYESAEKIIEETESLKK